MSPGTNVPGLFSLAEHEERSVNTLPLCLAIFLSRCTSGWRNYENRCMAAGNLPVPLISRLTQKKSSNKGDQNHENRIPC